MILVKCKCGCHFTTTDAEFEKMHTIQCTGCERNAEVDKSLSLCTLLSRFSESGLELYRIPDNSEIKFEFV